MTVCDAMLRHSHSPFHKKVKIAVCNAMSRHFHPLQSPADSSMQFEIATSVQPWRQVRVALHTLAPLRAAPVHPKSGPCTPPCCPSTVTSVVLFVVLVLPLRGYVCGSAGMVSGSLLVFPSPSRWLILAITSSSPTVLQIQGHPVHIHAEQSCSRLTGRDQCPTGERYDRAGHSR